MLNPAGLRRFPSPHSSLFFWIFGGIFGLKWGGKGRAGPFIGGTPGRPRGGGRQAPAAPVGWAQRRSPVGWATGPCRPPNGRQVLFFLQGLRCEFEEKKITLWACRPMGGRPGYIFEIFQNGHIFLKFYFFLNIKKKKPLEAGRKLNLAGNNSSWALWAINANPACPANAGRTACICTLSTVYTRHAPNTILNKNEKRTAKTTLRADVSFNVTSLIHHGWHKNCYIINSSSRMNKVWQTALIARINKNR